MDWECAQLQLAQLEVGSGASPVIQCAWAVDPVNLRTFYTDPTLMATRWFLSMQYRGASPPAQRIFAAVGLIAWSDIDFQAPAQGECPGPITHCDLDWINRFVFQFPELTAPGTGGPFGLWDTVHMSKAKRRLGNDRGILASFESFSLSPSTGESVSYGMDVRCLIKE
jgi:hypothetical protein